MITFFSDLHEGHAPANEFYRGELVPCFEKPSRAHYVLDELKSRGHDLRLPASDSRAVLGHIHTPRYLKFLESAWSQWIALDAANAKVQPFPSVWPVRGLRSDVEPDNFIAKLGLYSMDNGTPLVEGTWRAVKQAADAAFDAARLVSGGERGVFCATRPPGHHAGADFMGGYCFLNNAAVAAQTLRDNGCERVAIVDVDFHHGNGTQEIFYERSDVFFASIHGDPRTEYPFYLGHADEKGARQGEGFNLNIPLAAGTSSQRWFEALDVACDRVVQHRAQALVVSLGLDTFEGDPISKFKLTTQDYSRLGERFKRLGLPTVFILEGGYAASALGLNAVNVIDGFE